MDFIVVLEPSRQQSDYGLSIRQDRQPSIIAFEGFDECLRDAVGFWRADWRETNLEAQGRCGVERVLGDVRRAVVGQPFDVCAALLIPNRRSTQAIIRSRTISPEMPAEVASQPITSRSQASIANNTRTISPLRQASSK